MASDVTGTFGSDGNKKYLANNTDTGTTPASVDIKSKANYTGARDIPTGEWDVHGKYNWALNLGSNDNDIRQYIPKIELEEFNLTSSSQLNAFKLFLSQTQSQFDVSNISKTTIYNTNNKITSNVASYVNSKLFGGILPSGSQDAYLGRNNGVAQPGGFSESDPYYGLYQGAPTLNKYYLPYLNPQNMTSNLGTWKGIDGSTIASDLAKVAPTALGGIQGGKAGANIIQDIQNLGITLEALGQVGNVSSSLNAPGISKETIKAFAPNDTGDTITTTFYLFNTQSQAELFNNWNFLFTLTYQNLPNRKSLSRMDPPCIYTITVPGFKRFPVAVISGLKVDNIGTTRLVDITTGEMVSVNKANSINENVKIIPEAYKVTVTIQSLLTNTRNLFYYNYNPKTDGANIQVITQENDINTNYSNQTLNNAYQSPGIAQDKQELKNATKVLNDSFKALKNSRFETANGKNKALYRELYNANKNAKNAYSELKARIDAKQAVLEKIKILSNKP